VETDLYTPGGVRNVRIRLMDCQAAHRERSDSGHDEGCSKHHLSYRGPFGLINPLDEFGIDVAT
jgi:hypothetical protein